MKSILSSWLEEKRAEMGLTKGQMSEKIGVAVGQYSAYVNGKSDPRSSTIEKISKALAISVDQLKEMMNQPYIPEMAREAAQPSANDCETELKTGASVNEEILQIRDQLTAAQNKVVEGKLDLVIAMISDLSNRVSKLENR